MLLNCGVPAIAEKMKRLAEKHNKENNLDGKAWSRSRGHEEVDKDPEEPAPEPATKVQRTEGEPETKEQLIAVAGACETITSADGTNMTSPSPAQGISTLTPGMMGP